jgi:hypothetical protein
MNAENIAKFAAATEDLYDQEYGGWLVKSVETRDTIQDFVDASHGWAECSAMKSGEIAGFQFVAWERVQAAKGQPRRSLSVVDFGDVRVAMDVDLFEYI